MVAKDYFGFRKELSKGTIFTYFILFLASFLYILSLLSADSSNDYALTLLPIMTLTGIIFAIVLGKNRDKESFSEGVTAWMSNLVDFDRKLIGIPIHILIITAVLVLTVFTQFLGFSALEPIKELSQADFVAVSLGNSITEELFMLVLMATFASIIYAGGLMLGLSLFMFLSFWLFRTNLVLVFVFMIASGLFILVDRLVFSKRNFISLSDNRIIAGVLGAVLATAFIASLHQKFYVITNAVSHFIFFFLGNICNLISGTGMCSMAMHMGNNAKLNQIGFVVIVPLLIFWILNVLLWQIWERRKRR